ncbi:hypothetical protein [Sorangium sp. So ce513]
MEVSLLKPLLGGNSERTPATPRARPATLFPAISGVHRRSRA